MIFVDLQTILQIYILPHNRDMRFVDLQFTAHFYAQNKAQNGENREDLERISPIFTRNDPKESKRAPKES